MMEKLFVTFLLISLTGCIPTNINKEPPLSGTVVDSNSGEPLNGVSINTDMKSSTNGMFNIPAIVEKTIWSSPLFFGSGTHIGGMATFQKKGYRETTCLSSGFSKNSSNEKAIIPLVKIDESESTNTSIRVKNDGFNVTCDAFIGSRVEYQNKSYLIGDIYPDDQNVSSVVLWPAYPTHGNLIENVKTADLQLISLKNTAAIEWAILAKQGKAWAQLALGLHYADDDNAEQDYKKAFNLVLRAANQGWDNAQYELAKFYITGTGTNKNVTEAMNWLKKAANQDHIVAQAALGKQYTSRNKEIQDYKKARFWLKNAADQGHVEAMELLAVMSVRGQGAESSYLQAAQWLEQAVNAGSLSSTYNLAYFYLDGTGVPQNTSCGRNLLAQAAEQGHDLSTQYFSDLAQQGDTSAEQFLDSLCIKLQNHPESLKTYCATTSRQGDK